MLVIDTSILIAHLKKEIGRLKAAASILLADAAGSTLARRLDLPFWTKDEQLLQALQQTRWCSIWTSGPS